MKRGLTTLLLIGFILGIATGPFFYWHNFNVVLYLIVGLILLTVMYWNRYRYFALILFSLIFIVLGSLRFSLSQSTNTNGLSQLVGEDIELTGIVVTEPEAKGALSRLTIKPLSINGQSTTASKVLVTTPIRPSYEYGNLLSLSGRLDLPVNRDGFNYVGYLSRFGIDTAMAYPDIMLIKPFVGNPLLHQLYLLKYQVISVIQKILLEPAAALLTGLLFGVKSDLSAELNEDFNRVGLTHIIALSGFNITIIASGLLWLLRFLSLRWRYGVAIAVVILFVLMTGASPSVTRAAIMGILVLWAGLTGRLADSGIALLLAAMIMLLINPLVLYYDVGFQLSFVATIGIIYLSPIFSDIFRRLPRWLIGYLSPTLAALVFSTPLLVYQFERLSLIAPLANILVLPLISIAMGLGFIGALIGLIYLPIGIYFGVLAAWPLNYIVGVAVTLSQLPAASIGVKVTSIWWVIGAYAILGLGLIFKQSRAPKTNLELRPLVAPI